MSSPSAKRNYKACNHRHFLAKVMRLPPHETAAAIRGRRAHAFLEAYGRACLAAGLESSPAMFSNLLRSWGDRPDMESEEFDDLRQAVRKVEDSLTFVPGKTVLEFQFAFNSEWAECAFDEPTYYFRGVIDYIVVHDETRETIRDHKTGWGKKAPAEQIMDYAVPRFLINPNLQVVHTGWNFTRHGLFSDGPTVTRQAALEYHEKMKADLRDMDRPREVWEANGLGSECELCDMKAHCAHFKRLVEEGYAGKDVPDVLAAYTRSLVLKAQGDIDMAIVKAYAKANGMLHLPNGKIFTNSPKETVGLVPQVRASSLFTEMLKIGCTPVEVLDALDVTAGQVQRLVELAKSKAGGEIPPSVDGLIRRSDRADWREVDRDEFEGRPPADSPKKKGKKKA